MCELECLVELGASPLTALKSVTMHAAKLCGIERLTGTLGVGSRADIIGVQGNPLESL
jgi:imidazolonepropionase-like amidohydrolase